MTTEAKFNLHPDYARPGYPPGRTPGTDVVLSRVGRDTTRLIKRLAPKETGSMASTARWQLGVEGNGVPFVVISVGNAQGLTQFVDYTAEVEFGTSKAPAQPFIRPAINQVLGTSRAVVR